MLGIITIKVFIFSFLFTVEIIGRKNKADNKLVGAVL